MHTFVRLRSTWLRLVTFLPVLLLALPAEATLRRPPGAWLFGPRQVWTDGTTSAFFHPLSDPVASAGLLGARISIEMSEDSGYCKMRPAIRYSSDGVTWDGSNPADASWRTTNGIVPGTAYVDLTALGTPKSWVQFGVEVANDAGGSGFQFCNAALLVEPKER